MVSPLMLHSECFQLRSNHDQRTGDRDFSLCSSLQTIRDLAFAPDDCARSITMRITWQELDLMVSVLAVAGLAGAAIAVWVFFGRIMLIIVSVTVALLIFGTGGIAKHLQALQAYRETAIVLILLAIGCLLAVIVANTQLLRILTTRVMRFVAPASGGAVQNDTRAGTSTTSPAKGIPSMKIPSGWTPPTRGLMTEASLERYRKYIQDEITRVSQLNRDEARASVRELGFPVHEDDKADFEKPAA